MIPHRQTQHSVAEDSDYEHHDERSVPLYRGALNAKAYVLHAEDIKDAHARLDEICSSATKSRSRLKQAERLSCNSFLLAPLSLTELPHCVQDLGGQYDARAALKVTLTDATRRIVETTNLPLRASGRMAHSTIFILDRYMDRLVCELHLKDEKFSDVYHSRRRAVDTVLDFVEAFLGQHITAYDRDTTARIAVNGYYALNVWPTCFWGEREDRSSRVCVRCTSPSRIRLAARARHAPRTRRRPNDSHARTHPCTLIALNRPGFTGDSVN